MLQHTGFTDLHFIIWLASHIYNMVPSTKTWNTIGYNYKGTTFVPTHSMPKINEYSNGKKYNARQRELPTDLLPGESFIYKHYTVNRYNDRSADSELWMEQMYLSSPQAFWLDCAPTLPKVLVLNDAQHCPLCKHAFCGHNQKHMFHPT